MGITREAAEKIAEEERFEEDEDQFFASKRITERVDVVFVVLAVLVIAALAWGLLTGALA